MVHILDEDLQQIGGNDSQSSQNIRSITSMWSMDNVGKLFDALRNAGILDYRYCPATRRIELSDYISEYYGWNGYYDNMPYDFANLYVSEDTKDVFCKMYEDINNGGSYAECDFRIKDTDIWIRNQMSNPGSKEEIIVGVIMDVSSEYKRVENATNRFVGSVRDLYDAIYEVDVYNNTIEVWKEGVTGTTLNRYSSFRDYLEKVWNKEVHPDCRGMAEKWSTVDHYRTTFTKEHPEAEIEVKRLAPDATYKWYITRFLLVEKTRDTMKIMIYRKNVDDRIREQEERMEQSVDAFQLMSAINSSYDMVMSINLSKNTFYMINAETFWRHAEGSQGNYDELMIRGLDAIPEPYREKFFDAFSRENLMQIYNNTNKKYSYLEHPQMTDEGELVWVATLALVTKTPAGNDIMSIGLSRKIYKS